LAAESGYRLTLAERGLKASTQDAIWLSMDGTVPADPEELAVVVRRPAQEVRQALPAVLPHFDSTSVPGRLSDPALTAYRDRLVTQREKNADGAKKTNLKRWGDRSTDRSTDRSLNSNSTQPKSVGGPSNSTVIDDPFVHDLEAAEAAQRREESPAARGPV